MLTGKVTLTRHCASVAADHLCLGQMDVALSAQGLAHASQLAAQLNWVPDVLLSSDLLRTQQTALAFAQRFGLPLQLDKRLRELDMGEFTGRTWQEIFQEQPAEMSAWGQNFVDAGPPGGESFLTLQKRTIAAVDHAMRLGRRPLLITHAGPIRALLSAAGNRSAQECMNMSIAYGQSFKF